MMPVERAHLAQIARPQRNCIPRRERTGKTSRGEGEGICVGRMQASASPAAPRGRPRASPARRAQLSCINVIASHITAPEPGASTAPSPTLGGGRTRAGTQCRARNGAGHNQLSWIEHWTSNPVVAGSNPAGRAIGVERSSSPIARPEANNVRPGVAIFHKMEDCTEGDDDANDSERRGAGRPVNPAGRAIGVERSSSPIARPEANNVRPGVAIFHKMEDCTEGDDDANDSERRGARRPVNPAGRAILSTLPYDSPTSFNTSEQMRSERNSPAWRTRFSASRAEGITSNFRARRMRPTVPRKAIP
jgi:hypothetical protein